MGNIQLVLNIDRIDLIVAIAVVFIAIMAMIGFVTWVSKANKQMETLEKIDDKLHNGSVSYLIREKVEVAEVTNNEEKDQLVEKEETAIESNNTSSEEKVEVAEAKSAEKVEVAQSDEGEDILDEIQKMILVESKKISTVEDFRANNIGKSGKAYSREELENLIRD